MSKFTQEELKVKNPITKEMAFLLSGGLAEKMGINHERLNKIKELHQERLLLLGKMKMENTIIPLRELAEMITEVEYQLQDAWGFPRDSSMHYWTEVPKCSCPKMDNWDIRGTGKRLINLSCPVHGEEK